MTVPISSQPVNPPPPSSSSNHNNNNNNNNSHSKTVKNKYGIFETIAGYNIKQSLGSGSFANVYKGIHPHNTTPVAIKAIHRQSQKITPKVLQNLQLEISILQHYSHPNIVCLHSVSNTESHIFLILEYCAGGDLQGLIRSRKRGRLSERLARRLMKDLTMGLTFLAEKQLIHRDIKPQNLLLTTCLPDEELVDNPSNGKYEAEKNKKKSQSDGGMQEDHGRNENIGFHLKIADFGFARHLKKTSLADTLCGSPLYMAPEILQHQSYDNKADLWSAGTVLFEMIAGRPPFHGENHMDLLRNIQQKAVRLPPDLKVSKECVNLLRILLNRSPMKRAGFQEFWEASRSFVALGCHGDEDGVNLMNSATSPATVTVGAPAAVAAAAPATAGANHPNGPFANLGPISEEEAHPTTTTTDVQRSNHVNVNSNHANQSVHMVEESQRLASVPSQQPQQVQSHPLHRPREYGSTTTTSSTGIVSNNANYAPNDIRRGFSPLEPSPPGPKAVKVEDTIVYPPFLPLGNASVNASMNNNRTQTQLLQQQQQSQHQHQLQQMQSQSQQRNGKSESSQNSDDGEFVMVEKGLSPSNCTSTHSRGSIEDGRGGVGGAFSRSPIGSMNTMWKQSSSRRVVHSSSFGSTGSTGGNNGLNSNSGNGMGMGMGMGMGNAINSNNNNMNHNAPSSPASPRTSNASRFFSGKAILSSRNLIPPAIPFLNKGILSTSPGTGGALVGMMGGNNSNNSNNNTSTSSPSSSKDNAIVAERDNTSSFILPQNGVFNYELFARMLAAAEDVGRRAINVAHVGDTRAYLAMKSIIANENLSSLQNSSGSPMEGVIEEYCEEDGMGNGGGLEDMNLYSTMQNKRVRSVSTDQTLEDEDDEMPFAMPSAEDDSNSVMTSKGSTGASRQQQQPPPTVISSANTSKKLTKTSNFTIQAHFREALSCYIKSLTMLKGSVNASQRIIAELGSIGFSSASNEIESINQFKKRCEASNGWLVGQFKGVLERAEAGKVEIAKLNTSISAEVERQQQQQQQTDNTNTPMKNVEELIYNHSLACGRDGAVKQLLGQHEAARSCYRSAGLLIETLLMEPKLIDEDKNSLESYVQGFAERINELDYIMMIQNKQDSMVASGGSSRRGSSIVPVIGGGFVQSTTRQVVP